jgi:hypothetical protein
MFEVLGDSFQQFWLMALLVLWAALLFGGFVLGQPDPADKQRMATWTRMASSFTLVAAGWSWFLFTRERPTAAFALLIALGMTLGWIGDLFMAGLLKQLVPLKEDVLGGIGAFGLGHVAYIIALLHLGNQSGLDAAGPRWGALAAWLVAGAVLWYLVVYRGQKPTVLHLAALPYALLLASTTGFATGLALQSAVFWPLALGAGLFLTSDLILAAQLFNGLHFPLISDVIWLLYGPGQMLIVYSVASALHP